MKEIECEFYINMVAVGRYGRFVNIFLRKQIMYEKCNDWKRVFIIITLCYAIPTNIGHGKQIIYDSDMASFSVYSSTLIVCLKNV